jgi:catechol 2,3-dioxygenase-like lactoylglutathione lyase family enzyme
MFAALPLRDVDGVNTQEPSDPVEAISAVTLRTVDMAAAVVFYQKLGFRLLYGGPHADFTSFGVGTSYLNLQLDRGGAAENGTWGRVVFWVRDVDQLYQRALDAGFAPAAPPADASWGERYFHIRDPDGHELSLARPLSRPVRPGS